MPDDPKPVPHTPAVPWNAAVPLWRQVAQLTGVAGTLDDLTTTLRTAGDWINTKVLGVTPAESKAQAAAFDQHMHDWQAKKAAESQAVVDTVTAPVKRFFSSPTVQKIGANLKEDYWTPKPADAALAEQAHQALTARSDAMRAPLQQDPAAFPIDWAVAGLNDWIPNLLVSAGLDSTTPAGAAMNLDLPIGPALHAAAPALGGAAHLAGVLPPKLIQEGAEAARGIRAYHGSPHDFDRFDISKIGTGEGAQAYGHGLYFAENEGVARDYRNRLGGRQDLKVEGGGRLPNWVAERVKGIQAGRPVGTVDDLITEFKARLGEAQERVAAKAPQYWNDEGNIPGLREILQGLENVKQGAAIAPAGRMYEVNLGVDPAHLLNWDVPLRQQSSHVQEALRGADVAPDPIAWAWQPHRVTSADVAAKTFGTSYGVGDWVAVQRDATGKVQYHSGTRHPTEAAAAQNAAQRQAVADVSPRDRGENLYRDLQSKTGGGPRASELLHEAGIPGLRYHDAGSRTLPDPTLVEEEIRQLQAHRERIPSLTGQNGEPLDADTVARLTRDVDADITRATAKLSEQGTHNYVMFDDEPIDILRKYGILPPIAAAGAAGAAASQLRADDEEGEGDGLGAGLAAALPFMPIKLPRGAGSLAQALKRGEAAGHPFRAAAAERIGLLTAFAEAFPKLSNWRGVNDPRYVGAFGDDVVEAGRHLRAFAAASPATLVADNAREAAALQAWRVLHPGQDITHAETRALRGQPLGNASSKWQNVNDAWNDRVMGRSKFNDALKVEGFGNFMHNRLGPLGHPMKRSSRPANIIWTPDRSVPLISLPHDMHMLYGAGGHPEELLDKEWAPLRERLSHWEGLIHPTAGIPLAGNQGGLTNKDLYDRVTFALADILERQQPGTPLQQSFGRFWTGAQANKLLEQGKKVPFAGGLLDIYGNVGLLEHKALTDPDAIYRALERRKDWYNLGWGPGY